MEAFAQHNLSRVRSVVAVAAGKGGVGKSTLAVCLARYCASLGARVGVMDADLYGPSLKRMFPEDFPCRQNEEAPERIVPAESGGGTKLMSMAYFTGEANPASVRAPIANSIIKQFIHLVDWGELDYLFIDFPPGTGDIQLTLIQEGCLSGAVLVSTPQEVALLDVAKSVEMFTQMGVPIIGIVENMSHFLVDNGTAVYPFGKGGVERFAGEKNLFFLGRVPIEARVCAACDAGKSLFEEANDCPAATAFRRIGERVIEQLRSFEALSKGQMGHFDLKWEPLK